MANFTLDVPLVGQKTGYDGLPLMQPDTTGKPKQHGFMACWYAAACMVSYYYRIGPRLGIPRTWAADKGINVRNIEELISQEGLKVLGKPVGGFTSDKLAELLQAHGPIWAAGRYLDGYPQAGHAVTLTGVKGGEVLYNDPWEPKAKAKTMEWLNNNLLTIHNALLVKDQSKY